MDKNILIKNGIDIESSLEILGDMDMYNETLNDFLDEMKERMPLIEEYKNNKDMSNYAILVHALKGDSKYLGFTKLAELSLNHQLKSQEGNYEYIIDNYDELIKEVNRILKVVNEYLNS